MKFSIFFFSDTGDSAEREKYRLMLDAAKLADRHKLHAVWTPERHFAAFGGLYPNPSVTSAAIAAVTETVAIRAGSVIIPLQNPIRVAEEWSVVDNLSGGRVGISFGRGWNPNDFVLAPGNYADSKTAMYEALDVVMKLWAGEPVRRMNGAGKEVSILTYPRPLQKKLPVWVTAESEESFVQAGRIGANVLTHLVLRGLPDLERTVRRYRSSLSDSGHDPSRGQVTLMMHTFLADDDDVARTLVDGAYSRYVANYMGFLAGSTMEAPSPSDMDLLRKNAVERLFASHGLTGTPELCIDRVIALESVGVDEIACLIDFGIAPAEVLAGLSRLVRLRDMLGR